MLRRPLWLVLSFLTTVAILVKGPGEQRVVGLFTDRIEALSEALRSVALSPDERTFIEDVKMACGKGREMQVGKALIRGRIEEWSHWFHTCVEAEMRIEKLYDQIQQAEPAKEKIRVSDQTEAKELKQQHPSEETTVDLQTPKKGYDREDSLEAMRDAVHSTDMKQGSQYVNRQLELKNKTAKLQLIEKIQEELKKLNAGLLQMFEEEFNEKYNWDEIHKAFHTMHPKKLNAYIRHYWELENKIADRRTKIEPAQGEELKKLIAERQKLYEDHKELSYGAAAQPAWKMLIKEHRKEWSDWSLECFKLKVAIKQLDRQIQPAEPAKEEFKVPAVPKKKASTVHAALPEAQKLKRTGTMSETHTKRLKHLP